MIKKCMALLTVVCLILTLGNSALANSNANVDVEQVALIKNEGNTLYYLDRNKILKVIVEIPENVTICNERAVNDEVITATTDINVRLFESEPLTSKEISLAKAGELTKSDEAINPMGNIKAKLSVKYSWTSYSKTKLLRMISATSSYKILVAEGVAPQTCSLYWRAEGEIYKNGTFVKRGSLGTTKNYTTPKFSNVKLMTSGQSIAPITAGVTYKLKCSRGVNINVYLPLV